MYRLDLMRRLIKLTLMFLAIKPYFKWFAFGYFLYPYLYLIEEIKAPDVLKQSDIWLIFFFADIFIIIGSWTSHFFLGVTGFFFINFISLICFFFSWIVFYNFFFLKNISYSIEIGPICKFFGVDCGISFFIDYISYGFCFLTLTISVFVFVYAFFYMRFEKNIILFLTYLKLFAWSMCLLVLAGSWFTLILGWELIGITSFLLINFWSSKITTLKSAIKALIFNKISDAAMISALCLCLFTGSLDIQSSKNLYSLTAFADLSFCGANLSYSSILLFFLITSAFCKSAQFGAHFWLPDSMEAPVPASALIHSATLVSAGIYLMLRFNFLFFYCEVLTNIFMVFTSFTAFYGAIIACFQTDIKKILAYSTISHCGFIMFSIIMYEPYITMFYLFAHGFFKSACFICAGNYIQAANNYQDLSKIGCMRETQPFEFWLFLITLFNLTSSPLFFCFFSKHWLLFFLVSNGFIGSICICFLYCGAFCGVFYGSKLLNETAFSYKRAHVSNYQIKSIFCNDSLFFNKTSIFIRYFIIGLLLTAFFVLYMMWSLFFEKITYISVGYESIINLSSRLFFFATHIYFSAIISITLFLYSGFKKKQFSFNIIFPIIIISFLIFILF